MSDFKFEDNRAKIKDAFERAAVSFLYEASGELVSQNR